MKIKVCGMCEPDNIRRLGGLAIDYMGFIFYPRSPRFIGNLRPDVVKNLSPSICKTGVFVSELSGTILSVISDYALNAVQLHGNETPYDCLNIRKQCSAIEIIKVFSIAESTDLEQTKEYESVCDYFLFDTKTVQYGGSGKQFDWHLLKTYHGKIPFFLSGGIGVDDVGEIKRIRHPSLYGVDVNSKFEVTTGLKNIDLLKTFIEELTI